MLFRSGRAYGIPTVLLRFFNVYGPGQSLSNPYSGVSAIFMSRLKNGHPPIVYEDGLQSRDFVSVHDAVQAIERAFRKRLAEPRVFNVGSGLPTSLRSIAEQLARSSGAKVQPKVVRKFRSGDIRHCFADITAIREALGYRPKISLEEGFRELVEWAESAEAKDNFDQAQRELARRGLL